VAINKNKSIAAAQKFIQKGQIDKAIQEYLRVVQEEPQDVRTWLKIGDLYAKKGARQDATQTYLKVAEFYSQQGFYLKAVAVYKQILKLDPSLSLVNLKLAELYQQLGLVADALDQFELVAAHHQRTGSDVEAVAALQKATELDPQNIASHIKLAEVLSKLGRVDEAVSSFRRACELLSQQERHDDYLKVGERLLYHKPDDVAVAREMAKIYIGRNDTKRALAKIQLAIKADPRDIETLELLARAFQELGQIPKTVSVYKELARLHQDQNNADARLDAYRRILALQPDDPDAREALGQGSSVGRVATPRPRSSSGSRPAIAAPPPAPPTPLPALGRVATPIAIDDAEDFEPSEQTEAVSESDLVSEEVEAYEEVISEPARELDEGELDEGLEEGAAVLPPEGEALSSEHEIARILTETDVFIKYGLRDKAIEHLTRIFEIDPLHFEAREKLKDLFLELGREAEAIEELWRLVDMFQPTQPQGAAYYLREILQLAPRDGRALEQLSAMGHTRETIGLPPLDDDDAEEPLAPPPVLEAYAPRSRRTPASSEGAFGFEDRTGPQEPSGEFLDMEEAGYTPASTGRPTIQDETDRGRTAPAPTVDDTRESGESEPWGAKVIPFPTIGGTSPTSEGPAPTMEVEEGLEEAEFFLAQGLFEEARAILEELARSHPQNSIVHERLAELREQEGAGELGGDAEFGLAAKLAEELGDGAMAPAEGGQMLDVEQVFEQFKSGVEAEVGVEDSDTHFDLGIAYKEMGLLDDAVHEFQVSMRNAQKECICHTMIGLCYLEKGAYSEAIGAFKKGLYVEQKTEREELGLYYELGNAYELLNDAREALYYYQKVQKRDPDFRDVKGKIRALTQPRSGGASRPSVQEDDVDKAFDDLLSSRK